MVLSNETTFWTWIRFEGESLDINIYYQFDGIDSFFYLSDRLGIMESWNSPLKGIWGHFHHLVLRPRTEPEQHNIVPWAWEGILGHGKDDKVIQSFPRLRFLKMTPTCEICLRSDWAEKLVFGLVQWDDLLAMDKLHRGIPSYNSMLWVWWNWLFFDLSFYLGIMASWKSLAKGI